MALLAMIAVILMLAIAILVILARLLALARLISENLSGQLSRLDAQNSRRKPAQHRQRPPNGTYVAPMVARAARRQLERLEQEEE